MWRRRLIQPSSDLRGEFVLCATSWSPRAIQRRWTLIKIHWAVTISTHQLMRSNSISSALSSISPLYHRYLLLALQSPNTMKDTDDHYGHLGLFCPYSLSLSLSLSSMVMKGIPEQIALLTQGWPLKHTLKTLTLRSGSASHTPTYNVTHKVLRFV